MRVADGEWLRWKTGPFDLADPVATCNLASLAGETQDLWYAYDDMNRQVMVEGAVNGNAADTNNLTTAQGHVVTYDKNGNRTSDTFQGTQLVAQVGADGTTRYVVHQGRITVYYRYDAAGRLSETAIGAIDAQGNALDESRATVVSQNYYDAAGHLIQSGGGDKLPAGYAQVAANNPDAAFNTDRTVREYDADGRLQRERITDRAGVLVQDTNYAGGYDAVGNVLSYTITDGSGNVSRTTVTEIKGEEYKRSSVTTTKTAPSGVSVSASTRYAYDVNGELVRTDTTSAMGAVSTIKQTNDFDGNILQTIDGNEAWNRLVVDGQVYAVWDPPTGDTQAVVDAITAMYWELLDREPDAEGLAWWVHTVVEDGYSLQSVYDGIMASDEYKKLHSGDGSGGGDPAPDPGPTAADLVTQAYQALLGRTPSSQELQYWTGAMANGMSIFDVEAQMQASPEYENRQATAPDPGNFDANGNLIVSYRPGDTLQGLAQAAYGDASLAWVIAQANGLTAGSQLATLKSIVIPKVSGMTTARTQTGTAGAGGTPGSGTTSGATSDAPADLNPATFFAGMSRDEILAYISRHVPSMTWNSSIPTFDYATAYAIYLQLQRGGNLSDFPSKNYMDIVTRLGDLQRPHFTGMTFQAPSLDYITGRDASDLAWRPPQPFSPQAIQTAMNGGLSSDELYGGEKDYLGSIGLYTGAISTTGGSDVLGSGDGTSGNDLNAGGGNTNFSGGTGISGGTGTTGTTGGTGTSGGTGISGENPLDNGTAQGITTVWVPGARSTLFVNGNETSIADRSSSDGSEVHYYANGVAVTDSVTKNTTFVPMDTTDIGSRLSTDEYSFVEKRINTLLDTTDEPGFGHYIKATFDNLVGITPNPIRTDAQEGELNALINIAGSYQVGLQQAYDFAKTQGDGALEGFFHAHPEFVQPATEAGVQKWSGSAITAMFQTTEAVAIKNGARAIDFGKSYENAIREMYNGATYGERSYAAFVNGKLVNGVADDVTIIGGKSTAIEAKYVNSWGSSIRNPNSAIGARPFALKEQQNMIKQAANYSAGFEGGVIYHINSPELAAYYTQLFQQAGITNFRFVITPVK